MPLVGMLAKPRFESILRGQKWLILQLVDHMRFTFAHRGVNIATGPDSIRPPASWSGETFRSG